MRNPQGSFIWYELLTRDATAAKAFYDSVVGWNIAASAPPGGKDYRMIGVEGGAIGGVLQLGPEMLAGGARPTWLGYIGVDDVDASVEAVIGAGGRVQMPAFDIPGAGRVAMVTDPQGVPFYVMRGAVDAKSTAYQRMGLQHVSWNELMTPDPDAALAFYEAQFGIRKIGAMPMGPMGDYSFIANAESEGDAIGAVMKDQGRSGWDYYFRVPDIHAAKAAVEAGGGTARNGPHEVPGGELVLQASDPEGVPFGLVASPAVS
jgi:predicted enzyme related to lactoylglutathione lyase